MLKFWPLAILLFFGTLGCGRLRVTASDLAGTWVVTDESRQRFLPAAHQKAAARIVLDANGTFAASEIPEDLLYGPPEVGVRLITGSGAWRLESREGRQYVQLEFKTIPAGQRGNVPYATMLSVSKGWSTIKLFYFQGDADQGRRIAFEKK